MRPLRILQVCSSPSWGGMEMHVPIITKKLVTRGHTVEVICHPGGELVKKLDEIKLSYLCYRMYFYRYPELIFKLAHMLHHKKYDIIHCHYSKDLWVLSPAVTLAGTGNLVFTKHLGPGKEKKDILHRWVYSRIKLGIAISDYIHERMIDTYPLSAAKIVTLHYGVDLQEFNPMKHQNNTELKKQFTRGTQSLLVGAIGRISPGKGHIEFLYAVKQLISKISNVKFIVVGGYSKKEKRYADSIFTLCKSLGLENVVQFTGFRTDIPRVMSCLDMLVLPSYKESFGMVLIEAMAMGVPVIATDAGGVPEIVVNQSNGLLVPPHDIQSLTTAMYSLLQDNTTRMSMGNEARKTVIEKFNLELMIDKLERLYYQVCM